jgi:dTDP-4-dehydrorhamnose reductase
VTLLVVGSTGMLGQALTRAARRRGIGVHGVARRGTSPALDLNQPAAVRAVLGQLRPATVINAAALADLDACERDPGNAYRINARGAALLAAEARRVGAAFVQVSTDHYFTGDGDARHDEGAQVTLVNEYARTKFAAEALVLSQGPALVVRTNLAGWRGWPDRPSFVEWASAALRARRPIAAFSDFFTSTIDADSLAEAILDLAAQRASGLLNIAASDVASKAAFIRRLAAALGIESPAISDGSVRTLAVPRAESLGLDVRRAETLLGRRLPGLNAVIDRLVASEPRAACAS